jgi:NAD(P)-dependent dehydrogenase (short-subunit alcohol dehydrogenase family)
VVVRRIADPGALIMGELAGKVALITGAARGLGRSIAEVFAREGAELLLTDVADGSDTAAAIGGSAAFATLDVASAEGWQGVVRTALDRFGRIDVLVNNAGLIGAYPFDTTDRALWDRLLGVMATGPYLGIQAVLPHMLEAGSGSIVNIASTNSIRGMAQTAAYTAAKHGVLGLTRALALEYAKSGVRINAVCPGSMETPMLIGALGDQLAAFGEQVPIGRFCDPREVAEAVSFVASDRASYMIGAAMVVDGGLTVG